MLNLSHVTLIGVDCIDTTRLKQAADHCTHEIQFGAVKLLSSIDHPEFIKIPAITTKEGYSKFIMKELINYVETDFALIIQFDGYVLDSNKWQDAFMDYDYIGANWDWYNDDHSVGNGGFSLRSQKLLNILANDRNIKELHPEDERICRHYRPYLEQYYDIKFAPVELARQFSQESAYTTDRKYNGSFGWHGRCVDFNGANLKHIPKL